MKKKIYVDNIETNYSVDEEGQVYNDKLNRILKGTMQRNEYRSVQLTINNKPRTFTVHRLVAEAFIPNPDNLPMVDHIDQDKTNNKVSNLRWVDNTENQRNRKHDNSGVIARYDPKILDQGEWKSISVNEFVKVNKDGIFINTKTGNYLKGSERNGYIRIYTNNQHYSAHKLVWETFNGPIPENMVIDHIDGNRSNNRLENLRLVSQSDNMYNAQRNGHKGQIPISQYDLQGNFIAKYDSIQQAVDAVGGNHGAINQAAKRMGSSAGFLWIKDDQDITIEDVLANYQGKKVKSSYKSVSQYDENNNLIATYNSLAEAGKAVGTYGTTIKRAMDANRLCKGYYWKENK